MPLRGASHTNGNDSSHCLLFQNPASGLVDIVTQDPARLSRDAVKSDWIMSGDADLKSAQV